MNVIEPKEIKKEELLQTSEYYLHIVPKQR